MSGRSQSHDSDTSQTPATLQRSESEAAAVALAPVTAQTVTPSAAEMPNPLAGAAASLQMSAQYGNAFLDRATSGQGGALGSHVAAQLRGGVGGGGSIQAMLAIMRAEQEAEAEDTAGLQARIAQSSGAAIGSAEAARFGAVLGADLSDVTVHTDGAAQDAAAKMGAHAFAIGTDVYFGSGEYAPDTAAGQELKLHELQHVVQHKEGRLPTGGPGLTVSSPSDAVEREARAVASAGLAALSSPVVEAALEGAEVSMGSEEEAAQGATSASGAASLALRSEEAGAEAEAGAEEDDSWMIAAIKEWWPALGEVIDNGLVEALSDDLMEAADAWLEAQFADIDVDTFAHDIAEKIGGAAGGLVGAALGDQACCEAFEAWVAQFTEMADHFTATQTPIAMLSDRMTGGASDALAALGRLMDGTGVQEAVGGVIETASLWIDGAIDEVRAWNQRAGDWIAELLGVQASESGLVGLITEGAERLFTAIGEGISGAIDLLLGALFSIDWVEDLYRLVDFALEMKAGVAWLAANWGAPDLWEQVEALKSELPRFAELLLSGKATWDTLAGTARGKAEGWLDTVDEALVGLGLPAASAVYTFFTGLVDGVRWIVESPVWDEISGAFSAAVAYGSAVVLELIDVAVSVATCIGAPALIFPVIIGSGLLLLPACYKAPVFDFLISLLAASSAIWMTPLLVVMPFAAPLMQAVLEGSLQGMKTLATADKEALLIRFAELVQLQFLGEFGRGLLVGIAEGIIDEILAILHLVKTVVDLANPFTWIGWVYDAFVAALSATVSDVADAVGGIVEGFDDAGDRAFGEDDYSEDTPDVDLGEIPQIPAPEAAPEVDGGGLFDPSSWPSMEALLGGLVDGAMDLIRDQVAETAQGVVDALLSASEAPYTLGYGVGYIAGWVLVQVGLLVLTAGVGEALNLLRTGIGVLAAALKGSVRVMMAATRTAIASLGQLVDEVVRLLASIRLPGLGQIGAWLRAGWAKLVQWFDELMALLRGAPKKGAPKKGAPKKDPAAGDPKKDPKKDPKEGDPEDPKKDPNLPEPPTKPKQPGKGRDGEDDPPDPLAKGLSRVHRHAKADVLSALDSLSKRPATWAEAKAVLPRTQPVKAFYPTPTTRGSTFADGTGHPQVVDAVVAAADAVAKLGGAPPPLARTDPAAYAGHQKQQTIHKGAPLAAIHAEIWDKGKQSAAEQVLEDALTSKMLTSSWPNQELKDAVDAKGVVHFLTEMAGDRKVGAIHPRKFAAVDPDEPHSWYFRHPADGKETNKDLIKERFRSANGKRQHEWIPRALLIDIVLSAQHATDAEQGGLWISLANNMRASTTDLVFRPARRSDLDALLIGFVAQVADGQSDMKTLIDSSGTKVDDWALGGHVGALYLEVDGLRTAKPTGSETFHQALEALWDFRKDPHEYPKEILDFIKGYKDDGVRVPGALWDGKPEAIVPPEFLEPTNYAPLLPSGYVDSGGTSWGDNLQALGQAVRKRFDRVEQQLRGAKP